MRGLFSGIFSGRKVLITGHTGFKGSWLSVWLEQLGAKVAGYSLPPPTQPNHFDVLKLNMQSYTGDIRDKHTIEKVMADFCPEVVFHLAAQPLVRYSYKNPHETFETNVLGTLNVCEAARRCGAVRALVIITTDKVYENREWEWGYRENDPLGGYDPYSASKACAEILVSSFRNSFVNTEKYGSQHHMLLSSVRAGNVIGGGDWSDDRIIPDIVKAAVKGEAAIIRSPSAIRPWQHVLECLAGYLMVAQKLLQGQKQFAIPFNFGPAFDDAITVEALVRLAAGLWKDVRYELQPNPDRHPHEANYLKLDYTRAYTLLKWRPVWKCEQALRQTMEWYRNYYDNGTIHTLDDIQQYVADAKRQGAAWV